MHVLSEHDQGNQNYVYRLDARTKIFICLCMSIGVIFLNSIFTFCFLVFVTLLYAINLRRYRILFMTYVGIIFLWLTAVLFMKLMHMMSSMVPVAEPVALLIPFLRISVMLNAILVLALSSRVQSLLTALKSFRLPVWLYIPSVVMIRFIPTFIKDVQQIHESMRIRGYSLNPFFILVHPVLSVRLMVAPIVFRALRSSDDLGIAAELKGVGHMKSMTTYKPSSFKILDFLAVITTIIILITGWWIQTRLGGEIAGFHP